MIAAMAIALAMPAHAAPRKKPAAEPQVAGPTQTELRTCQAKSGASASSRIEACTALIESKSKKAPPKGAAYLVRANAYRDTGDMERAIRDFGEAIRLMPNAVEPYRNRAIALRDRGELQRAAQDLEQVLKLDKKNTEVMDTLSHIYYDRREYGRAIEVLNLAIKLNPSNGLALFNRGMAFRAKGEPDRAIPDYDRAIKINPSDRVAWHNRGIAYRDIRDRRSSSSQISSWR